MNQDLSDLNLLNVPSILPFHGIFSGFKPGQLEFIGDCVAKYNGRSSTTYHLFSSAEHQRLVKFMEKMPIGTVLEGDQSTSDWLAGKNGRRHFWKKTEIGMIQVDTNIDISVMFDIAVLPYNKL
jgi:hypothetical protein